MEKLIIRSLVDVVQMGSSFLLLFLTVKKTAAAKEKTSTTKATKISSDIKLKLTIQRTLCFKVKKQKNIVISSIIFLKY